MFSKLVNFVPIDLKIGTHIDHTNRPTMYLANKILLYIFISANNKDIGQKLLDTYITL